MSLTYFPVTGKLQAVITDANDALGAPDIENISSFVYFTPSTKQVYSTTDHTIYRLQTKRARTNIDDGIIKNIDGTQVSLVANTADLTNPDGSTLDELTYIVSFDHTVYDQTHNEIFPFQFVAPYNATTIELSTVEKLAVPPQMGTMNYAIGIVAHHTRQQMADQLATQTQASIISTDPGNLGPNTNHQLTWRNTAELGATWTVILEDDAQPIPDFRHQLSKALDAAPAPIVSLYLGKQRPPQHQADIAEALDKADANQAHWIISNQLYHAVAVAIRTECINNMLNRMRPYLPIDENIGQWARHNALPIAYTVPSLVNHMDGPTLIRHPDDAPRPPGRRAWRIGIHHTWNQTMVEI